MAVVQNHPVTATVNLCLAYCAADKIDQVKDDASMEYLSNYPFAEMDGDKSYVVYETPLTYLEKNEPGEIYNSFKRNMERYGKHEIEHGNNRTKDGKAIIAWHYVQSFKGFVPPNIAHEIGVKLAQKFFAGFPVQVSTHTNRENIHNHFVICAWANDGHKWHQCNNIYKAIREESDRLCREYGLNVLEATSKQKLVEWTDADGKKHLYEPTDRKNNLLEKRKAGLIAGDEVGSYRHTEPYQEEKKKDDTLTAAIRADIDRLLPYAQDYEHLLRLMREQGYTVKAKKRNGEYLAHVTFTPPGADINSRGKRDSQLHRGSDKEDGYYCRENLTRLIAENVRAGAQIGHEATPIQDPVVMGQYEYGTIDLDKLDDNYRTEPQKDGSMKVYLRGEVERDIILTTKRQDYSLRNSGMDLSDLYRVIDEVKRERRTGQRSGQLGTEQKRLAAEIQQNLDSLSFVERKRIFSYSQANEIVSGLWQKQRQTQSFIDEAKEGLNALRFAAALPDRLEEMRRTVKARSDSPTYAATQYAEDARQINAIAAAIVKYGVDTPEKLQEIRAQIAKNETIVVSLEVKLESIAKELKEYQNCMEVMRRIDSHNHGLRADYFRAYDEIFEAVETDSGSDQSGRQEHTRTEPEKQRNVKTDR